MKVLSSVLVITFLLIACSSVYAIDCGYIETQGNTLQNQIKADLNREIGDRSYRIDGMQKLYIKKVKSVKFKGCDIEVWIGLKIKRQIFGDASGKLLLEGTVYDFDPDKICLEKIKVTKLDLSNSSSTSRRMYRSLLNEVLKDKQCFVLR